jgi:hypothetical protein
VEPIAHDEKALNSSLVKRLSCCLDALPGIAANRNDDQSIIGNALLSEIAGASFGLTLEVSVGFSTDEDDRGSVSLTKECGSVVETSAEGASGPTVVLGSTENEDRVGGCALVAASVLSDS